MRNPLINKQHIQEYFGYGGAAAALYLVFVCLFLTHNRYENFYFLYIGSALFMTVIFFYALHLLKRPHDGRKGAFMLFAGHLASLAGVLISCALIILSYPFLQASLKNTTGAPLEAQPSSLLFMLLAFTVLVNMGAGSLITIVTAYTGKKNQTKDEPVSLDTEIEE